MYRAKDLGRARLEIYDETMRRRSAHRLELSEQLAEGIEIGDIVVRFQPGVDTRTGRVTCVEALARWQHPTRGLLAPSEFIGLAEETGLIVGLGLRVLSTACEHGRRWEEQYGPGAPRVHVNLSARQLTDVEPAGARAGRARRVGPARRASCASRSPRACSWRTPRRSSTRCGS